MGLRMKNPTRIDPLKVLKMERELKAHIEQQAETIKALEGYYDSYQTIIQNQRKLINAIKPVADSALDFVNAKDHEQTAWHGEMRLDLQRDTFKALDCLKEAIIKWQTTINIEDENEIASS